MVHLAFILILTMFGISTEAEAASPTPRYFYITCKSDIKNEQFCVDQFGFIVPVAEYVRRHGYAKYEKSNIYFVSPEQYEQIIILLDSKH